MSTRTASIDLFQAGGCQSLTELTRKVFWAPSCSVTDTYSPGLKTCDDNRNMDSSSSSPGAYEKTQRPPRVCVRIPDFLRNTLLEALDDAELLHFGPRFGVKMPGAVKRRAELVSVTGIAGRMLLGAGKLDSNGL